VVPDPLMLVATGFHIHWMNPLAPWPASAPPVGRLEWKKPQTLSCSQRLAPTDEADLDSPQSVIEKLAPAAELPLFLRRPSR
jgi:hypothetical protein